MTAPIGGNGIGGAFGGGVNGLAGRRPLGLDIAGEHASRALGGKDAPSFGDTLKAALGQVSEAQDTAHDYVQRFLRGEAVELYQVMAATEEAGIAIEMLVELRNKFTEAYRSVVAMQS